MKCTEVLFSVSKRMADYLINPFVLIYATNMCQELMPVSDAYQLNMRF